MIAECLVVEVSVTGDDCPLATAARKAEVRIDARPPQRRGDGNALLGFSAPAPADAPEPPDPHGADADAGADGGEWRPVGEDPDAGDGNGGEGDGGDDGTSEDGDGRGRAVDPARYGPVATALDADDRIRYLHAARSDDRVNFRCLSKDLCVVHDLTDAGFLAESLEYAPGRERHAGAVVGYDVLEGVLAAGAARSEEADPVGVTVERIHPLGAEDDHPVAERWSITPAQEAAVRTALELGYFSIPREADAGDVAAELGIGKSAFLERLRRAQRALFEQLFQ